MKSPVAGGPLPRFEGINGSSNTSSNTQPGPLQSQNSGGPIRVPPLAADKINQYAALFDESGAQNGLLAGVSLPKTLNCVLEADFDVKVAPRSRFLIEHSCLMKSLYGSGILPTPNEEAC